MSIRGATGSVTLSPLVWKLLNMPTKLSRCGVQRLDLLGFLGLRAGSGVWTCRRLKYFWLTRIFPGR
jgi:hypothetical protein